MRKHFFSQRIVHSWNTLPSEIVTEIRNIIWKHGLGYFLTKLETLFADASVTVYDLELKSTRPV